jgi:23S rRNA (adenine-N6)-dimethyltransferase
VTGKPARWGWHQLDSRWAEQIVADAGIGPGHLVIDVGAGAGALTRPLVEHGARVIAVELHPDRARALRDRFIGFDVKVVRADASDLRLPKRPFRVIANPPFSITVSLLRRLVAPGSRLVRADLVVPRHTASQWVSGSGPGSDRWARTFDVTLGRPLPRSAFRPPPPNGVAILTITRKRLPPRVPVHRA